VTTRRSSRGEARGTELVALARTVLVGEGLDRFVLRDIAARAGMTVGNLQYYFPTRDDLLSAVVRAELDRDLGVLRALTTGASSLDEAAELLIGNWCDGGSNVYAAVALLAFHDDRFRDLNREVYETVYAELGPVLRTADPGAGDAEIAARARLVTALLDGVAGQLHAAVWDDAACADLRRRATASLLAIAHGR
jgi:AcrR family transcriptional regulator